MFLAAATLLCKIPVAAQIPAELRNAMTCRELPGDAADPQRSRVNARAFRSVVEERDVYHALGFLPRVIEACRSLPEPENQYLAARYSVRLGILARDAKPEDLRADYSTNAFTEEQRAAFEKYYDRGVEKLKAMADGGTYPAATWMLVATYLHEGRVDDAVELSRRRAQAGDPAGQFALGRLYWSGLGVEKDTARAVELISASGAQGYPQAQFTLGWMYDEGRGVAEDDARAVEQYEAAVQKRDPLAAYALGLRARDGIGRPQDLKRALELFEIAAQGGLASGMAEVGWAHLKGRGTEVDQKAAWVWLGRASAAGHAMATVHWALLTAAGEHDDSEWHVHPEKGRVAALQALERVDSMTPDPQVRELAHQAYRKIEASPLPPATRPDGGLRDPSPTLTTGAIVAGLVLGALLLSAVGHSGSAGPTSYDNPLPPYQNPYLDPSSPESLMMMMMSGGASLCC